MDGAELLGQVRDLYPDLPVLLITGYTGVSDDVLGIPRLAKPFGQAEIAAAIAALFAPDEKILPFPQRGRRND